MFDASSQGEEALEAAGDIVLNLFRGHAAEKSGDDHNRNLDGGKEIDRHPCDAGDAQDTNHQAEHDDKVGEPDGKFRHTAGRLFSGQKARADLRR